MPYDPPRQPKPKPPQDPLEIELVYNVRSCGTCEFFWPQNSPAAIRPLPGIRFHIEYSRRGGAQGQNPNSFVWMQGITRPPAFPDARSDGRLPQSAHHDDRDQPQSHSLCAGKGRRLRGAIPVFPALMPRIRGQNTLITTDTDPCIRSISSPKFIAAVFASRPADQGRESGRHEGVCPAPAMTRHSSCACSMTATRIPPRFTFRANSASRATSCSSTPTRDSKKATFSPPGWTSRRSQGRR